MMISDAFWLYAMVFSNVVLAAGGLLTVIRVQREQGAMRRFLQSPGAAAMQADAYDDRSLRRMIDQRIASLQVHIDRLQRPEVAELSPQPPLPTPVPRPSGAMTALGYAARMARQGASVADLVNGYGLNKGEAELLVRLHARRPAVLATVAH